MCLVLNDHSFEELADWPCVRQPELIIVLIIRRGTFRTKDLGEFLVEALTDKELVNYNTDCPDQGLFGFGLANEDFRSLIEFNFIFSFILRARLRNLNLRRVLHREVEHKDTVRTQALNLLILNESPGEPDKLASQDILHFDAQSRFH